MEESERDPRVALPPEEEDDDGDHDRSEPGLDISSDRFDPLAALYSPEVSLPYPNIRCFNNIAEYESFMKGGRGRAKPENVEKKLRKAQRGKADPERIERLKKLMLHNPAQGEEEGEGSGLQRPARRRKALKNVLTRMPLFEGSPLGELNRCVQDRIRVRVHIRSFKGLRGVCSGFVVAFDKFWNLAMVDVDETYRDPLLGKAFYHEKALTITRLFEKLRVQETQALEEVEKTRSDPSKPDAETTSDQKRESRPKTPYGSVKTRHVKQLFIRGENVLLINIQPD